MFDSLTSRATFYDITGYLIPGICSEGVVWLWFYAFRPEPAVALLSGPLWTHGGFVVAIILVATGYITGHLMNSFSSLVFQKWICKARFERAANWQNRIQNDPAARTKRIAERASEVFGIPLEAVNTYELRIRGEEELPQSFVTGFSFLSFYGMNRTLALLSVLAAIPCCVIACRIRLVACPCFSVLLALGLTAGATFLFLHQYLRFAMKYHDYLASTLLVTSRLDAERHVRIQHEDADGSPTKASAQQPTKSED